MIIALNLTDHCNFRCKMCAQTEDEGIYCAEHIKKQNFNNRKHGFIELDTVKKVLNDIRGFGPIESMPLIWLGESMMHPQFYEILKMCVEFCNDNPGLLDNLGLNTNASYLTPELNNKMAELLKANPYAHFNITFSIDAFRESTFYEIKRYKGFTEIIENVKHFLLNKPDNINAFVQTLVLIENSGEIKEFVNYWSQFFKENNLKFKLIASYSELKAGISNYVILRRADGGDQRRLNELYNKAVEELL